MTPSVDDRAKRILDESETRITPRDFARQLAQDSGITPGAARLVLKQLVSEGEIAYTYDFGATHVAISFLRPVRVTDHFILTPWKTTIKDGFLGIIIAPGISFGSGAHPTTRICLEAIDHALLRGGQPVLAGRSADVGTGSGVLALAMVRSGCTSCLALDIDLNCVSEAGKNVILNHLESVIEVTEKLLDDSSGLFAIISANLRFPTLKNLAPLFRKITEPHALLILSGVRTWELNNLMDHYLSHGFNCTWTQNRKGWSGAIFQK